MIERVIPMRDFALPHCQHNEQRAPNRDDILNQCSRPIAPESGGKPGAAQASA